VRIPAALRQRFPDEMTIVLQHQYWNLAVDEQRLAVTLRFGGTPEHLQVPFSALTAFADPSVNFGLRLDSVEASPAAHETPAPVTLGPRPIAAAKPAARRPAATRPRRAGTRPSSVKANKEAPGGTRKRPAPGGAAQAERATPKVVDFHSFRRGADDEPRER
jgi:hypothetical protein